LSSSPASFWIDASQLDSFSTAFCNYIKVVTVEKPKGPLQGIRVLDLTRLAPGPYCTMLLADLGADVVVVGGGRAGLPLPDFSRGKRMISLDLKKPEGRSALQRLVKTADVLIEGFRPGVAARLGAGYEELAGINPQLIYCSLTGYGQSGPMAMQAGHDINYLAISGVLGALGPSGQPPLPPLNIVADFAAGSICAAFAITTALYERERSAKGQFVDVAMIDGCISMMAMYFPIWRTPLMEGPGNGIVSGTAPFYRCYECSDKRYVAFGALERAFFEVLWKKLYVEPPPDHMNTDEWPDIEAKLTETFKTRTRDQWALEFSGTDACLTPVLAPDEIWSNEQIAARFPGANGRSVPPMPNLSRTPSRQGSPDLGDLTTDVLKEAGFTDAEIEAASDKSEVLGLSWPPTLRGETVRP
jgi:alpha-methylacyl-CoA racemase